MKIQYALMSCTADARYTEYWPTVATAWLKLGITPVCLFIPDNPAHKLPEAPDGIVHTIPPLKNVHISIQGLTLRFWGSCLYPKATVIVSDIDAIPLSRHFFCTQLGAYPDDAYLHLKSKPGGYPFYDLYNIPEKITHIDKLRFTYGYSHIARGDIMQKVLAFSSDWETSCKKTVPYYLHKNARITTTGTSYAGDTPRCGDELYISRRLHYSAYRPIFYISHIRSHYKGIVEHSNLRKRNIKIGEHYVYAHFSLPYSECAWIIERLIKKEGSLKLIFPVLDLIKQTDQLVKKVEPISPWLSFVLIILVWCFSRILAVFLSSAGEKSIHFALTSLFLCRMNLITRNPQLAAFDRWLLRIKNAFRLRQKRSSKYH